MLQELNYVADGIKYGDAGYGYFVERTQIKNKTKTSNEIVYVTYIILNSKVADKFPSTLVFKIETTRKYDEDNSQSSMVYSHKIEKVYQVIGSYNSEYNGTTLMCYDISNIYNGILGYKDLDKEAADAAIEVMKRAIARQNENMIDAMTSVAIDRNGARSVAIDILATDIMDLFHYKKLHIFHNEATSGLGAALVHFLRNKDSEYHDLFTIMFKEMLDITAIDDDYLLLVKDLSPTSLERKWRCVASGYRKKLINSSVGVDHFDYKMVVSYDSETGEETETYYKIYPDGIEEEIDAEEAIKTPLSTRVSLY